MRSFVLALAVMLASCAHAEGRNDAASHTVAQVMIAAMAPAGSRAADNTWDAVQARVSPPVRWQGGALEVVWPDEPGSDVRRRGSFTGGRFAVSAQGSNTSVRRFSIDIDDAFATEALLQELRTAGAEVSGAGDDESAMFYYVALSGRETAQLEARRVCRPFESREARDCRSVMTWNYELQ
jgi:hypothetical protein